MFHLIIGKVQKHIELTVGPARREVPESAIAEQPPEQYPEWSIRSQQYIYDKPFQEKDRLLELVL